jgi:hypothetical protein
VVVYQPENHSTVYYEYDAKGSSYNGAGSAEGYAVGDQIAIRYSNKKPWVSEISDNLFTPRELLIFCFSGSLFLSTAGTLVFFVNGLLAKKLTKPPSK